MKKNDEATKKRVCLGLLTHPLGSKNESIAFSNAYEKSSEETWFLRSFPFCTPLGIRTLDPLIKSQLLYQLS